MANKQKFKLFHLTTWILLASVGGIVFGALVGPWSANLQFVGDIFIRLIQMSVVLLVMTSISTAIANTGGKDAGKMGFYTFKWIILFTIVSAFLGLALGLLLRPGNGVVLSNTTLANVATEDPSFKEMLVRFVPMNIIDSMAKGDMVPTIVFSILFGLALGEHTRSVYGNPVVLDFFTGFNRVIVNIIKLVMNVAPIGIFCMLANIAGTTGFRVVLPMFKFLGALLVGDMIQLVAYGILTGTLCKVNPLKMPQKFSKMSIMALTTTSSAICLPTKMEDSVTKFGISRHVSDFTGPITMSMNSNGAVQCYVIAVLFMAQTLGIELGGRQLLMAIIVSCLLCMGTIVVPGGMIVVYTFLADFLGLPLESIAILIGIDWFSGMLRTLLNVDVDVMVGMLVANKLGELDRDIYNGKKTVLYEQTVTS